MTTLDIIRAYMDAPERNAEILADIDDKSSGLEYVAAAIIVKAAYRGGKVDSLRAALERGNHDRKNNPGISG